MSSPRDVYILSYKRTPFAVGKAKGAFSHIHPVTLLSKVLEETVPEHARKYVDDCICGCVTPIKDQGSNIGRLAVLKAGFPITVPSVQINRMCGSGQQALIFGSQAIASGDAELIVACGVEMMSRCPMGSDSNKELFNMDVTKKQKLSFDPFPYPLVHQGASAEYLAEKYGVSREECDKLAKLSHEKLYHAIKSGYFKSQIIPIDTFKKDNEGKVLENEPYTLQADEGVRYPMPENVLSSLPTVFKKGGVVTPGNASQISDGSSAILLGSDEIAKKLGFKKLARIVSRVSIGSDPVIMLDGVIPATLKAVERANLTLTDIDLFEINEAFACVVVAWQKVLKIPSEKINIDGGAIAHGHPLGATGNALIIKLVEQLRRTNKRYGLATLCIGFGNAVAVVIENTDYTPKSKL